MPDPAPVDGLAAVRDLLIHYGGGFLRNVRWDSELTCPLCQGLPNPGFPSCYNCSGWIGRDDLADRLGFIAYGVRGHQSGTVMYGYKDPFPSEANKRVVTLMHHYAVIRHRRCLDNSPLGPVTHWTTVPSLSGRTGLHPLHGIASSLLDARLPRAGLTAAPEARKTRDLRPANFQIEPRSIEGAHVLLIEDTWVGGGNIQSAAYILKQMGGAASVTGLVLARWIEPHRGQSKDLLASLTADYDPDLCPFTGARCG